MKHRARLTHEFVQYIPDVLREGTLYISIQFATVVHKCCCGCGKEVVTPLSPTDWKLIFDGETISLDPSVGNWSYPCQSHYWITESLVEPAPAWSRAEIETGQARDRIRKGAAHANRAGLSGHLTSAAEGGRPERFWSRFKKWLL